MMSPASMPTSWSMEFAFSDTNASPGLGLRVSRPPAMQRFLAAIRAAGNCQRTTSTSVLVAGRNAPRDTISGFDNSDFRRVQTFILKEIASRKPPGKGFS